MREEFFYYILVFDKTFGLVPTYQHKMRDQNLVVRGKNLKTNEWIDWSKSLKVFCYQREKTQPKTTNPPCEDSFNILVRG